MTPDQLSQVFLSLEERGAHNINLVSPTHNAFQIAKALEISRQKGLSVPVVYNSNGYDSPETLKAMEGLIDVYLPDLKYKRDDLARKCSSAPSYFIWATRAIVEMSRQVGVPVLDSEGLIKKGLIVRHLVLPSYQNDSIAILRWIKETLPKGTYVSLMAQYYPTHKAKDMPPLNRTLTQEEYDKVVDELFRLDLLDGYVQEISSAKSIYTPDFA